MPTHKTKVETPDILFNQACSFTRIHTVLAQYNTLANKHVLIESRR